MRNCCLIAQLLHRVDDQQRAARHEHALDQAGQSENDPQRPFRHELLLGHRQVLDTDDHNDHAVDLQQDMQGHQGIQPNAQHHEHDHRAQDLAKLAPIHALDVECRQQAAGEKALALRMDTVDSRPSSVVPTGMAKMFPANPVMAWTVYAKKNAARKTRFFPYMLQSLSM